MPLELSINNEQQVNVVLHPVTAKGNPASVDGAPAWSVVDGDSTVTPAEDGLSAELVSANAAGDTHYLISADVDLGAGVITITDTILLHVVAAMAAALGPVEGAITLKP